MPALGDATWTDIAARPRTYLAVPLGSTEQHGPHLPLNTDTAIAHALADGLSRQRSSVLTTPAVAVGASGEHAGFAGTLSIGIEVMRQVIIELVRSADWATGVVLVNGHGGNSAALSAAVAQLNEEGRNVLSWWPSMPNDPRADSHAGWVETSVMMHLDPGSARVERSAAGDRRPVGELLPVLRDVGVIGVSPNGVLGDPAGASAETGAHILEGWVGELVARFDTWAT